MKEVEGDTQFEEEPKELSLEEVLYSILITNLRIYDTLMALLREENEEVFDLLYQKHERGGILTSQPALNPKEML